MKTAADMKFSPIYHSYSPCYNKYIVLYGLANLTPRDCRWTRLISVFLLMHQSCFDHWLRGLWPSPHLWSNHFTSSTRLQFNFIPSVVSTHHFTSSKCSISVQRKNDLLTITRTPVFDSCASQCIRWSANALWFKERARASAKPYTVVNVLYLLAIKIDF